MPAVPLATLVLVVAAACQPTPSEPRAGCALIVHGGELWRYDIAGRRLDRLTEDDALNWAYLSEGDRRNELVWQSPSVSPDGAWLAYSPYPGMPPPAVQILQPPYYYDSRYEPPHLVLQPITGGAATQVIEGARDAVWAPDSQRLAFVAHLGSGSWEMDDPPLWVYDLAEQAATPVLPGGAEITGVWEVVWSPDSTSLAYIAHLGECRTTEECRFEIQRLDVTSGVAETVTEVEVGIASRPSVCWTEDGQVVVGEAPNARCSSDSTYVPFPYRSLSPDGARVARLEPSEAEGATRLWVEVAYGDGAALWERELTGVAADHIVWSGDTSVLLLNGTSGGPIWRVAADGSGEVEVVVREGLLIRIVPQW